MSDLVERLRKPIDADRLYDWIIEKRKETTSDFPRLGFQNEMELIDEERHEAAARITELETALAEAEGRVKWVFPKSIADMPAKPGKAAYEYVECLILRKGEMLARPWNCEHQVFDDEAQDDFFCEWSEVTAYMDLTAIRALASDPLLDRQGDGKEG